MAIWGLVPDGKHAAARTPSSPTARFRARTSSIPWLGSTAKLPYEAIRVLLHRVTPEVVAREGDGQEPGLDPPTVHLADHEHVVGRPCRRPRGGP